MEKIQDVTLIALMLCVGYVMGNNAGFSSGRDDGKDTMVVYCNLSAEFCRLQLDRMAERPKPPALFKAMFAVSQ